MKIWGFRGPLGAFIAAWGGVAMITSAPFDDWWHSAYGLDVKILSPPHVLLIAGILAVQLGTLILILGMMNRVARGDAGEARLAVPLRRRHDRGLPHGPGYGIYRPRLHAHRILLSRDFDCHSGGAGSYGPGLRPPLGSDYRDRRLQAFPHRLYVDLALVPGGAEARTGLS